MTSDLTYATRNRASQTGETIRSKYPAARVAARSAPNPLRPSRQLRAASGVGTTSALMRPSQVPAASSRFAAVHAACPRVVVQRKCGACEEEPTRIQARSLATGAALGAGAPSASNRRTSPLDVVGKGAGNPLPLVVRADMERRLGSDFSAVRIHTSGRAADSAAAVSAEAYTVGNEIVFAAGAFSPHEHEGRKRLAHELIHVQQQRRGPVHATPIGGGIAASNPSDAFEEEATVRARRAVSDSVPEVEGARVDSLRDSQLAKPFIGSVQATSQTPRQLQRDISARSTAPAAAAPAGAAPAIPSAAAARPFQSLSFRIVAKSFIRRIDAVGSLSCGPNRTDVTPELILLAVLTDSMMGETAPTDARDKGYRMFSAANLLVDFMFGKPVSVAFGQPAMHLPPRTQLADIDTDNGREGPLETPPLIIFGKSITGGSGTPWRFSWSVKGRPALAAEPGFQLVCPRTSRYIWHRIEGEVDSGGLKNLTLSGSHFPTHRLFVDGALTATLPQGTFSNLWIPAASDPTMVK
jgi:Domain of unknown function (DUF4157)